MCIYTYMYVCIYTHTNTYATSDGTTRISLRGNQGVVIRRVKREQERSYDSEKRASEIFMIVSSLSEMALLSNNSLSLSLSLSSYPLSAPPPPSPALPPPPPQIPPPPPPHS